ncbi:MAG: hypothetical protein ABIG61_12020 [Planctomycetota bacterium]
MSKKILWRHRKRSEANPFKVLECGCKQYIYNGTIVRQCEAHRQTTQNTTGKY